MCTHINACEEYINACEEYIPEYYPVINNLLLDVCFDSVELPQ